MTREFDFLHSVGLRHVIRDALDILGGSSTLDPERRQYVLKDLAAMVSDAKRCTELGQSNTWFVAAPNQEALEIVALMERQLGDSDKPWREWLSSANQVFSSLLDDKQVAEQALLQTVSLLQEVLISLANRPTLVGTPSPFGDQFGSRA